MSRPVLEVADIFRDHGLAWRRTNAGHVSLDQMKVMSAIERCRTAALGGHVARCEHCAHTVIAYNSCRNRHCPKCQGAAAQRWLAEREAELIPVQYFHVVYTLPAPIADIAYQNKAAIYDLLFKAAAEATLTQQTYELASNRAGLYPSLSFDYFYGINSDQYAIRTSEGNRRCTNPRGGLTVCSVSVCSPGIRVKGVPGSLARFV